MNSFPSKPLVVRVALASACILAGWALAVPTVHARDSERMIRPVVPSPPPVPVPAEGQAPIWAEAPPAMRGGVNPGSGDRADQRASGRAGTERDGTRAAPNDGAPTKDSSPAKASNSRAASLDRLFERLAKAKDDTEAEGISRLIERRWLQSGSDTADLLMSRAMAAVIADDQPLAIELLDRVIAIRPGWAEAWNKRSTIFYMMGDQQRAVADIRQALALEPRHYVALSGLGLIFSANDDDKHALEAYRRALAVNPHLSSVKEKVRKLAPTVDGRDL